MPILPNDFIDRMKIMLREEANEFFACYQQPHFRGIRLNPLKCAEQTLRDTLPFQIQAAPFSPLSYYIPAESEKIGSLPMHHAGAFYSQEPSASSAVTILAPEPGDRVLDLCAAPGGKSTQIASLLGGEGLLWSNEIVRGRAMVLLSNIERMGVKNAVVSSYRPDSLCERLSGYFDKVLVDAPCSGEGMFRRDAQAVADWSVEHVKACSVRQLAILNSAANAVKENGILVYSTCTFSQEENEGAICAFLKEHSDFALEDPQATFGRPAYDLPFARRIFPMDGGEGHFVARMRRLSQNACSLGTYSCKQNSAVKQAESLYRELFHTPLANQIEQIGNNLLLLPQGLPQLSGLGVIRAGVLLGEVKTNRIEPAHAVFMAAKPEELNSVVSFAYNSPQMEQFLRGEELEVEENLQGFTGVAANGVMVGFGKCSSGRLKNHYPKGLRNN
ncbi:MAG TPA: RsmB/NOP family class I SAM-dependent RNA methyltransferase [Oscillospiraceae bacterium]|nr:RsmB/NOP family class I SAM-dependent RNA methyltransferase [Oscillospiraceae bacterium]